MLAGKITAVWGGGRHWDKCWQHKQKVHGASVIHLQLTSLQPNSWKKKRVGTIVTDLTSCYITHPVHQAVSPQIFFFFLINTSHFKSEKSLMVLLWLSSPDFIQTWLLHLILNLAFPKMWLIGLLMISSQVLSSRVFTYGRAFNFRNEIFIWILYCACICVIFVRIGKGEICTHSTIRWFLFKLKHPYFPLYNKNPSLLDRVWKEPLLLKLYCIVLYCVTICLTGFFGDDEWWQTMWCNYAEYCSSP